MRIPLQRRQLQKHANVWRSIRRRPSAAPPGVRLAVLRAHRARHCLCCILGGIRVSQSMALRLPARAHGAVRERCYSHRPPRSVVRILRACACPTPPLDHARILSPFCRPWWMWLRASEPGRWTRGGASGAVGEPHAWNARRRRDERRPTTRQFNRSFAQGRRGILHAARLRRLYGDVEASSCGPKGVPQDEKSLV